MTLSNNQYFAGMKSGEIKDEQLSSSGSFENKDINTHLQARLDSVEGAGAWSPSDHNPGLFQY